jgi:bacterioferritin-associated ferredoxin
VIICQCRVVSDRSVTQVVAAGARSLAQVCRATTAGGDCGSCVSTVRRLLVEHLEGCAERVPALSAA